MTAADQVAEAVGPLTTRGWARDGVTPDPDRLTAVDDAQGWAGANLDQITALWGSDWVADLCREDRVPPGREHDVLEALRCSRTHVLWLLDACARLSARDAVHVQVRAALAATARDAGDRARKTQTQLDHAQEALL